MWSGGPNQSTIADSTCSGCGIVLATSIGKIALTTRRNTMSTKSAFQVLSEPLMIRIGAGLMSLHATVVEGVCSERDIHWISVIALAAV